MRSGQITQLTLGGFQVFAERTTFPLAPITLIFGPNSAGKSAITDALQVLAEFGSFFGRADRANITIAQQTASLLERHWHRTAATQSGLAEEVTLGMRVCIERHRWAGSAIIVPGASSAIMPRASRFAAASSILEPWLSQGCLDDLEFQLRVLVADPSHLIGQFDRGRGSEHMLDICAEVLLSGQAVFSYETDGVVALNLGHPSLGGRVKPAQFEILTSRFADRISIEAGWLKLYALHALVESGISLFGMEAMLDAEYESAFDEDAREALAELVNLFDAFWLSTVKTIQRCAEVKLVPASRTVPTRNELTYLMDELGDEISDARLGLALEGRNDFRRLAAGTLLAMLGHVDQLAGPGPRMAAYDIERVNALLTEHLFRERGYFVASEVHALNRVASKVGSVQELSPAGLDRPHGYLVTLLLEDAAGRQFSFEEVGSGLGYVMPVLVAIASGRRSFIQQPELHLHPALQADLADAFIAGLDGPEEPTPERGATAGQYIVETHSEHLLLRLLRRIRQSEGIEQALNAQTLAREDLVVLYVNPRADGTSKVINLRVARDGEFIDRWPRGFFEERWRELFDE